MEITLLGEDDLPFLNEIRNECSNEFLHDSRTFTLEETKDWFVKTKPYYWLVKKDNEKIGYFRCSNYSEINKNIYIGADIHNNHRGKGFGYEMYKTFIPKVFKELGLHKISLEVLSTNERAIYLYKKLGFVVEGVKREEVLKNKVWVDSIIMSILRSEYESL